MIRENLMKKRNQVYGFGLQLPLGDWTFIEMNLMEAVNFANWLNHKKTAKK